jgi:hypothetical protein
MGLRVSVFRDAASDYDCTNGGISRLYDRLTVVNADGPFDPTPDAPAVMLDSHVHGIVRLVPVEKIGDDWFLIGQNTKEYAGPMFGGNFAATSDSRFGDAIEKLTGQRFYGAIAIHDRLETWPQYEALSR